MDVKLDKETIIKHRFWFSLPVIALCILIGWGCQVNVRSVANQKFDQANAVVSQLKALSNDPERRNTDWVSRASIEKGKSDVERGSLWILNFDRQNDVVRFSETPTAPPARHAAAVFRPTPPCTQTGTAGGLSP